MQPAKLPNGKTPERYTRLSMIDGKRTPAIPILPKPIQHVADVLFSAGPTEQGFNGPTKISSRELLAWYQARGQQPDPWEFDTVRHLSEVYCDQLQKSIDPDCSEPWK